MNPRRRRATRLLGFATVVLLGAGYATTAGFVDTESGAGETFTAGTLDLTASPSQAAWTVGNMAPGDTEYRAISLGNSGTLALDYSAAATLTSQNDAKTITNAPSPANEGLGEVLALSYRGAVADQASCQAGPATIASASALALGSPVALPFDTTTRRLEPGDSELVCLAATLPIEAGNVYQGDSASVDILFNGEQTSRTSTGETLADGSVVGIAPLAVAGTASSTAVALSWPAVAGAASYRVSALDTAGVAGAATRTTTEQSLGFTGLSNGRAYSFRVQALGAGGAVLATGVGGPFTPSDSSAPPVATSALTLVATGDGLSASWTAFTAPASCPVAGYLASAEPDATGARTRVLPAGATSLTFAGLNPDVASSVSVRAFSACGTSEAITAGPTYPVTLPGTPSTPIVTKVGDASLSASWREGRAPSPAASYTLLATDAEGVVVATVATTTTSATVTGLDRARAYTLSVVATNRAGSSPASPPSPATAPITVPGALTYLSALASASGATLTWAPSTSKTLSPPQSYDLVVADELGAVSTRREVSVTTFEVTDLDPARTYRATLTPRNAAGPGPSATSAPFTVVSAASAPATISAAASGQGLRVSWSPGPGSAPVTGYRISATDPDGAVTTVETTEVARATTLAPLKPSTAYTLTVMALNAAGPSAPATTTASTAAPATTTAPAPGAPTDLVARASADGVLEVTWGLGANSAGVDTWQVVVTGGSQAVTVLSDTTSARITGLDPEAALSVRVIARSGAGDSPASTIAARAAFVPTAPTALAARAGDASLTLTWSAPGEPGSGITGYRISAPGATSIEVGPETTTATLTNLSTTEPTTVTVTALGRRGEGGSAGAAALAATAPSAPRSLSALAGDGAVALAWSAPASGSPVTGYRLAYTRANGQQVSLDLPASATSRTLTGLDNAREHTFTLSASNAAGTSAPASASATPQALSPPPAPRALAFALVDGAARLSWQAGSSEDDVTYDVKVSTAAGAELFSATTSSTFAVIPDLDPATQYVAAVSATGAGGASPAATLAFRSSVPPGAPTSLVASSPTAGALDVTWSAPTDQGPVNGYEVVATPAGASALAPVKTSATSATITGLDPAKAHTITVVALGPGGPGPKATTSAYPVPAPAAPADLVATPGASAVDLTWAPGAGGGAVSGYDVLSTTGSNAPVVLASLGAQARSFTASPLDSETAVVLTVRARSLGGSASTSTASIYPAVAPGAPGAITATAPSSGQVRLVWSAPTTGTKVGSYKVAWQGGSTTATTTTALISGLDPATEQTFTVVAINAAGISAPTTSAPIFPALAPGAPRNLAATSTADGSLTATWVAPATGSTASPATSYTLVATTPGAPGVSVSVGATTSATITGLDPAKAYTLTLTPANGAGAGAASTVSGVYPITVPAAVTNITGVVDNGQVTLAWSAPATGSRPTGYTVSVDPPATSGGSTRTTTNTSVIFNGLDNGVDYTFTVAATNTAGPGQGVSAGPLTPTRDPGPVTALKAAPAPGSAVLTWNAPTTGAPVKNYTITASPAAGSLLAPVTTTARTLNVTSLTTNSTYDFTVVANSAAGASAPVSVVAKIVSAPGAPASANLTSATVGSLTGSWTPPTTGGPAESYQVTLTRGVPGNSQTTISQIEVGAGQALTSAFTGLDTTINTQRYQLSVMAVNGAGTSTTRTSNHAPAYPAPAPSANVQLSSPAPGTLVVTTDPAVDYGTTSVFVRLSSGKSSDASPLSAPKATFTGLEVKELHSATLTVKSAAGDSTTVTTGAIAVAAAPTAPTSLVVKPLSGGALVSWNAPATTSTASAATSYTLTTTPAAGGAGTTITTTSTNAYLSGLVNDRAYTVSVSGTNLAGTGPAASSALTPSASATRYTSAVLGDTPIGYWPFDDSSRAEITGLSPSASNSGLGQGAPALTANTTGTNAKGATGKTSDTYHNVVPLRANLGANSFAVEAWVPGGSFSAGSALSLSNLSTATPTASVAGTTIALSAALTTAGRYVVLTRDATTGTTSVYLDGVLAGSAATAAPSLGAELDFSTTVDEVAAYDHALTAAQVGAHHAAGVFVPGAVRSLTAVAGNNRSLAASWAIPVAAANTGAPTGYTVQLRTGAGTLVETSTVTTTSTSWSSLPTGTYTVSVAATNPAGSSGTVLSDSARVSSNITAPSQPTALQDAPVSYFGLGEASGATSAANAGSSGAPGTLGTGVVLGAEGPAAGDQLSNAATFAAASRGISAPLSATPASGPVSIEAWVKPAAIGSTTQTIYSTGVVGTSGYNLFTTSGVLNFSLYGATARKVTTPSVLKAGVWNHVTVVYDGATTVRFYLNGALVAGTYTLASAGYTAPTGGAYLGWASDNFPLVGSMAAVGVYDKALSAQRVQVHYLAGS